MSLVIDELTGLGQSLWLDNISRKSLENGHLIGKPKMKARIVDLDGDRLDVGVANEIADFIPG